MRRSTHHAGRRSCSKNCGISASLPMWMRAKRPPTERILYFGGSKHKAGDVDDGNTTTDFDPLEKAKGHHHQQCGRDPGMGRYAHHADRHAGPRRLHRGSGAQPARSRRGRGRFLRCRRRRSAKSETVWHQADRHGVPRIAFVNKLDRMGADFFDCVRQMKEKLGVVPAVCTIPAGQSSAFEGVIDLIRMKFCGAR